jgi:hypothetical protein
MFQRAVVIASVALFGVLVSSTPGAAQQTSPSPCSLLQPNEIKAAFHGMVGAGDPTTASGGSESLCEWIVMLDPHHGYGFTLHVRSGFDAATFKQQRQGALGTTRTIVKLGDDAYSERSTPTAPIPAVDVWVLHGSVVIGLEAAHNVGTKPLVKLARLVLGRL